MTLAAANDFRTKGADLAKRKVKGYEGLYFGMCNTVSTRIRCEVCSYLLSTLGNSLSCIKFNYCFIF